MAHEFAVRPAAPADAQTAASLIRMAMGQFADYLFGAGNSAQALDVIGRLFALPLNRFSHQFADIVDTDGRVSGIMLSYPGQIMNRLDLSMGRQLWSIYGAPGFARFVGRSLPLAFAREASAGDYFINALAAHPDYRGQGIGTHLLSYAENKAREMRYDQCALSVEVSNLRARQLYERVGYRAVETVRFAWSKRLAYAGYHRMVKTV